ncbi:hypothetical protein HII36_10440 [Nonomuraea sp. NN258]|uniref:hypothetical protein n=1 Tax=Nonomuraea antri TaxID=2730852 RepID=UPI00156A2A50|nr:hypothetical protein [Nonomuraea antri]NRQ32251.1 hypothetical protein [Nonomuraea antri]
MTIGLCLLALWFAGGLWQSGVFVPHLSQQSATGMFGRPEQDEAGRRRGESVEVYARFANDGWLPVTITGVAADTGYTMRTVRFEDGRGFPRTLAPGEDVRLQLGLVFTDCLTGPDDSFVFTFEVDHWWGRTSVAAPPASADADSISAPCGP